MLPNEKNFDFSVLHVLCENEMPIEADNAVLDKNASAVPARMTHYLVEKNQLLPQSNEMTLRQNGIDAGESRVMLQLKLETYRLVRDPLAIKRLVKKMMAQRDEYGKTVESNHDRWQFPVDSPLRMSRRSDMRMLIVAHVWSRRQRLEE